MSTAKPVAETIQRIAECANCGEQLVASKGMPWSHAYTGKKEC